jgi:hypothetical protein
MIKRFAHCVRQIHVLQQDNSRLLKENNALHLQLIKSAEGFDVEKRTSVLLVKKLKEDVAELHMWKKQSIDRYPKHLSLRVNKGETRVKQR